MHRLILTFVLAILSASSQAAVCDKVWVHLAGISKHVEVYQPNEYTRYKRQTHPGIGIECEHPWLTIAAGEFTNSLDRPFLYATAARDVYTLGNLRLFAGVLTGEYGRTVREPLRLVAPIVYLDFHIKNVGLNFFALPPAKGFNDYAIFFTQFKIGF
ncbi:MAG: hypothetical protein OEZ43_03870 [Gammaproteobacteria bacterium]|nr:hypothetical protein [Gammaproteobacteria bacterium]